MNQQTDLIIISDPQGLNEITIKNWYLKNYALCYLLPSNYNWMSCVSRIRITCTQISLFVGSVTTFVSLQSKERSKCKKVFYLINPTQFCINDDWIRMNSCSTCGWKAALTLTKWNKVGGALFWNSLPIWTQNQHQKKISSLDFRTTS